MKIVHLRVENLASVAEADIDFEAAPLAGEPIYLICGDTGAGKTTLLDAITLALYGCVSRYQGRAERGDIFNMDKNNADISVSDVLNIVRRGASSALAEVTFTTDDGQRYLARWAVARARRKTDGRFQSKARELHNLTSGLQLASNARDCDAAIPRIIGLTYAQFTKTVLLPQNQFAEFLRAPKRDKSEILEMLVGNDIYTLISRRLHDHTAEARRAKEEAEVRLGTVRLLTDEERQQLTDEVATLGTRRQQALDARRRLERQLQLVTRRQGVAAQRTAARAEWEARLTDLATLSRYAALLRERGEALDAQAEALRPYTRWAEFRQTIVAGLTNAADLRRRLRTEAQREQTSRTQLPALQQQVAQLSADLNRGNEAIQNLDRRRGELRRQFELLQLLLTRAQNAAAEGDAARQCAGLEDALRTLPEQLQLAAQRSQLCRQQYEQTDALYQQQSGTMKDWVRACRAQLRPGQPCPVCGNTDHHLPTDEYLMQLIAAAEAHRKEAHQQWTRATAEEAALVARQGEWQKQLQQLRRQHEQLQQRLRQTLEQLRAYPEAAGQADPTAEQVEAAKQLWSETETRYTASVKAVTKLQSTHADATRRQALLEQAITHSAELQQQYRSRYDAQLTDLDPYFSDAAWRSSWQADPAQFQQSIEQQVARVTQWGEARDAWQKQTEQSSLWQEQSAPYQARIHDLEPEWPQALEATHATDAATHSATTEPHAEARLGTLPQQMAALVQRLETLQREAAELAAAADLPAEEVTAEALTEQIAAATPALKTLEEKYYAAQGSLKADDEHRRTWSEFSATLQRLQAEYELWNSLDVHFGSTDGEKFRGIAQSWTLQLLLEQTNGILRSLCPRYELLCETGSLVILVRDLSDGGVVRVVNGVSGGETFILSLALSLALSQLNDNGLHIESLFIDEGFGSLSEGYLDNALTVLERLHNDTGGRQIGIISHVAKLRERIPVHLCVERTDSYTSQVVVRTPGGE